MVKILLRFISGPAVITVKALLSPQGAYYLISDLKRGGLIFSNHIEEIHINYTPF